MAAVGRTKYLFQRPTLTAGESAIRTKIVGNLANSLKAGRAPESARNKNILS
jgi:hypothetical protein